MDRQIAEVQSLATKYSKAELGRMVQLGLLDPQKAMMAGMMIDRIQKQNAQPPQTTVAQDVLGLPGMQQRAQQAAGLETLPAENIGEYAGGGIVAFADGGDTDDYAEGGVARFKDQGYVKSDWQISPAVQAQRDQGRQQILMQELADARDRAARGDPRAQGDIDALTRELRRMIPKPSADAGITSLISSAQAADTTPTTDTSSPAGRALKKFVGTGGQQMGEAYRSGLETYDKRLAEVNDRIGELSGFLGTRQQTAAEQAEYDQLMKDRQVLMNARNNLAQDIDKYSRIAPSKPAPAPAVPSVEPPAPPTPPAPPKKEAAREEVAPAAEKPFDIASAIQIKTMPVPKDKSLAEIAKEQDEADALLGVNKDFFNQQRQEYKEMGGKFEDRRNKAAGMALMMWGAGVFAAREGQEAEYAGKFGQQALMGYMSAIDKINENEDKIADKVRELNLVEENYKRTRSKDLIAKRDKLQSDIQGIQFKNIEMTNQATLKAAEVAVNELKVRNPELYMTYKRLAEDKSEATGKKVTAVDILIESKTAGIEQRGEISRTTAFKEYNDLISNPIARMEMDKKYPGGFEDYFRALQGKGAPAAGGKVDTSNPLLK